MPLIQFGPPGLFSSLRALASLREGASARPSAAGRGALAALREILATPTAALRSGRTGLQEGPLTNSLGVRALVRAGADVSRRAGIGRFLDVTA